MLKVILEWLCFGGSLFSVYLYGKEGTKGPICGMVVALLFVLFGVLYSFWAAALTNIVFFALHARNFMKARTKQKMEIQKKKIEDGFGYIQEISHRASVDAGWWHDLDTGEPKPLNVAEKLCLVHSEISEAMEGDRKDRMDDKLPHRKMIEVELADAVIRIADLAGKMGLDIGGAIAEKIEFNTQRPDHKVENRRKGGGKKY